MADSEQAKRWSDTLAAAWERHRERLFESQRPLSEWLVERLEPEPGQTILELAAGPGETGFLAAERVGPEGKVISTDIGPQMVEAAKRGVAERGLNNVECRVMDAQDIDLPANSVDAVLSRFGVMLLPEPERALAGSRRVLRSGGRLAYGVWGAPDRNPWLAVMAMALVQSGHPPAGNPFGPGGPFSLADPDRNRQLVTAAGLSDPVVEEFSGVMAFEDFDDYWNLQSQVSGPIAITIASLPTDDVEKVRDALRPMLEPFKAGNGYELPSYSLGIAAISP